MQMRMLLKLQKAIPDAIKFSVPTAPITGPHTVPEILLENQGDSAQSPGFRDL